MENLIQKHLQLLCIEREEEISQGLSLLSNNLKNVKELQSRGICLSKLEIESQRIGLFGRHIINFQSSRHLGKTHLPTNSITIGDIVGIFCSGHILSSRQPISGVVIKSSEIIVGVAFEELPEDINGDSYGSTLQLVKLANDVTYKRMKRALDDLKSTKNSSHLINVLFQCCPPGSSHVKYTTLLDQLTSTDTPLNDFNFINTSLDLSQKRAVLFALSRPDLAIIHGPPGTGKTTTVIEYILQCIRLNKKILACAPSNIAVDNLVERLACHKIKLVRLGHPARLVQSVVQYSLDSILNSVDEAKIILDVRKEMSTAWNKVGRAKNSSDRRKWQSEAKLLKKELLSREEKLIQEILKTADVILSTNTGAGLTSPLKHLPQDHFDVVVIDECAQSLEASCWIPITRAPVCLLAGDHKQLPPTILSEKAANDGLAVTLMERLVTAYGNEVTSLLTTQYRMHHDIMKWPSQYLYKDNLTAHSSVSSHLLKDLPCVEVTSETSSALFFIDTAGCGLYETCEEEEGGSKGNEGESEIVLAHVKELLASGVASKDIAIIAPYNLQVELIRQKIDSLTTNSTTDTDIREADSSYSNKIEVHTVDGFQGREKEAVIISFTRSNQKGEIGFLKEQRRTNVAVTRARRHLALIGDSDTLSHEPFIKGLIDYCTSNGEVRSAHEYIHYCTTTDVRTNSDTFREPYSSTSVKKEKGQDDNEAKRIQQRLLYEKQLKDFLSSSNQSISFPSSLSSALRKIIHELSEELGLIHVSHGEGRERHIIVSKDKVKELHENTSHKIDAVDSPVQRTPNDSKKLDCNDVSIMNSEDTPTISKEIMSERTDASEKLSTDNSIETNASDSERTHDSEVLSAPSNSTSDSIHVSIKGPTAKAALQTTATSKEKDVKATEGIWKCTICGFNLPLMNKELHLVHCEKRKQKQESTAAKKKTSHERKDASQRKRKSKTDSSTAAIPDDLDTLLEQMRVQDKTCNFTSCKKSVNHLGITCPFCHKKYCMTHNMAEIHGCEEIAKRTARQQYIKSMEDSRKPQSTTTDPKKRAQLQRKLDKKINDMSSGRQRKKPPSS